MTVHHHATGWRPLLAVTAVAVLLLGLATTPSAAQGATTPAEPDTDYGRMLLVLDSSGSMAEPAGGGTTKIEAAKRALGDVIDGLPDEAYVGLRVYGTEVFSRDQPGACRDSRLVVPPGTDNRAELTAAVGDYEPYGETPIGYALQQAARDIGGEGTRSIVLVSDGVATCEPDPCDVAADLAEKGIDLQIDVVGLSVDATARSQLRCIAAAGNGTYYDADSAADIVESLSTAAERAVRPFEIEGTPVEGGTSSTPTTVGPGLWSDALGDADDASERWFAVERTIPGSTLHLGVSGIGSGDASDSLLLQASLPEGASCGTDAGLKQIISGALVGVGVTVDPASPSMSPDCATADRVLVKVARALGGDEGDAPFSLTVAEEPPVDSAALPAAVDEYPAALVPIDVDAGGDAEPVVGGSSFGEATEVSAGRYAATMVPGETQVFRVRLEYGQTLSTRVVLPAAAPALREQVGVQGPFAQLGLFNPFRMDLPTVGEGTTTTGFATGATGSVLSVGTTEVRYNNRADSGNTAFTAGDYYIVYSSDEDSDGRSYEMPFTLEVGVTGEESGAPAYPDGEALMTAEQDPSDQAEVEPSDPATTADPPTQEPVASDAAEQEDATPVLLVGGLVLVALVCLALGLLVLRRSRA